MLKRLLFLVVALALSTPLLGQTQAAIDLEKSLGFEAPPKSTLPGGWGAYPNGTVFADEQVVHGGKYSTRIERNLSRPFSTVTKMLPIDFKGKAIELRAICTQKM